MVTKKVPLVFTEAEKERAAKIREYANKCSGTFIQKYGEAAQYFGYDNYGAVPERIRQCISSLGGTRSGIIKRRSAKIKVTPKK